MKNFFLFVLILLGKIFFSFFLFFSDFIVSGISLSFQEFIYKIETWPGPNLTARYGHATSFLEHSNQIVLSGGISQVSAFGTVYIPTIDFLEGFFFHKG